jgi:hypothetical protein
MDALYDAGTVFGLLGMLILCTKVGLSGQILLRMPEGVTVFSTPLMMQP